MLSSRDVSLTTAKEDCLPRLQREPTRLAEETLQCKASTRYLSPLSRDAVYSLLHIHPHSLHFILHRLTVGDLKHPHRGLLCATDLVSSAACRGGLLEVTGHKGTGLLNGSPFVDSSLSE